MARPPSNQPTDGELEILQVLWGQDETPLGDIRAALQAQRPVATTTVATMLKVMLGKGLVRRRKGPQGYLWSADRPRRQTQSGLLRQLVDRVFDGSAAGAVVRLLEEESLGEQDREAIRRLLDQPPPAEPGASPEPPSEPGRSERSS